MQMSGTATGHLLDSGLNSGISSDQTFALELLPLLLREDISCTESIFVIYWSKKKGSITGYGFD